MWCAENGVHAVVGTTGFSDSRARRLRANGSNAPTANAVIAPNFAIGAVLMMRFAEMAAPYFETRRDHRAASRPEDRRAVGHGGPHRAAHGGRVEGLERRPDHQGRRRGRARRARRAASRCTRCGCAGWSRTRRCCSARPVRACRSATTPTTVRASCPASCSRCRRSRDMPGLTIGLDALLDLPERLLGKRLSSTMLLERLGVGDDFEAHAASRASRGCARAARRRRRSGSGTRRPGARAARRRSGARR